MLASADLLLSSFESANAFIDSLAFESYVAVRHVKVYTCIKDAAIMVRIKLRVLAYNTYVKHMRITYVVQRKACTSYSIANCVFRREQQLHSATSYVHVRVLTNA